MRVVSPLLRHVVYPALSSTGYLRRFGKTNPAILTYHGIIPVGYEPIDSLLDGAMVAPARFRAQIRWLKSRFEVVTPEEFLCWLRGKTELPARAALLTCDDGLVNNLTDMLPILQDERVSCLFFVTDVAPRGMSRMLWYDELYLMFLDSKVSVIEFSGLGLAGNLVRERRSFWWRLVRRLSSESTDKRREFMQQAREQLGLPVEWELKFRQSPRHYRRFYRLDSDELQLLASSGMQIGAHTLSHPVLSKSTEESVWKEVVESQRMLESVLGKEVWAFAYPFGDAESVTNRELELVGRAGYECAFLNSGGASASKASRFAMPRVHVTGDMTLGELDAHLAGFHESVRARIG